MKGVHLELIYTVYPEKSEAIEAGRKLVASKLAACVNLVDGMISIYEWKGKLNEDQEVILLAKTNAKLLDKAMDLIRSNHSYECPAIFSFSASKIDSNYQNWLDDTLGIR
tara:strand:+ start:170 stop:499 length:330 start_codon:yes stop_codon:yes gene_type:complete